MMFRRPAPPRARLQPKLAKRNIYLHNLSQGVDEEDDDGRYTNDNRDSADGVEQPVAHPGRHGAVAFLLADFDLNSGVRDGCVRPRPFLRRRPHVFRQLKVWPLAHLLSQLPQGHPICWDISIVDLLHTLGNVVPGDSRFVLDPNSLAPHLRARVLNQQNQLHLREGHVAGFVQLVENVADIVQILQVALALRVLLLHSGGTRVSGVRDGVPGAVPHS
mmetsp:Transcript_37234/g.62660  ORF Transcript_37234/g.62660 Transcript_37234/m.62660 type:complete len:218 (+) Transcript_37234:746-1399(+)